MTSFIPFAQQMAARYGAPIARGAAKAVTGHPKTAALLGLGAWQGGGDASGIVTPMDLWQRLTGGGPDPYAGMTEIEPGHWVANDRLGGSAGAGYSPAAIHDQIGLWQEGQTGPSVGGSGFEETLQKYLQAQMAGGGGGGGGRYDTAADTMNAQTNRMEAESMNALRQAQIADMMAQQSLAEYRNALDSGNLTLAREKFQDSQTWSQRSADAQDYQNQINAQNAQTSRIGTVGGLAVDQANVGLRGYEAQQTGARDRSSAQARGGEGMAQMAQLLGNLGIAQQELGLKIASTPRNAIAGALMSRGQDGGAAAAYNPSNLLGINPQQIQQMIQQATGAFQQSMQMPQMQAPPQFDLSQVMGGLNRGAQAAQMGLPPQMIPQSPSDGTLNRVVGNRVNGYQSVYDRMKSGGAPQMVLDQFRQGAASAAYPVE